jgi:adenylosuccinate lyase
MAQMTREQRKLFGGPFRTQANSGPKQWAGRTLIASGSATVTVSTQSVKSDDLISYGVQIATAAASATNAAVEVKTIVEGGYFTMGYSDNTAKLGDRTIMWEIVRTS